MNWSRAKYKRLIGVELKFIMRFYLQHPEFRVYYFSGATKRDKLYFLNSDDNPIRLDELVVGISPNVNKGCLLAAYLQAFEDYESYLKQEGQKKPSIDSGLHWMRSPTDLSELLIALAPFITKDNRPATQREINEEFGSLLHVDLANSAQLDSKRRNTLGDISFLVELAEKWKKRKNKLIDKQDSRRPRS